MQRQKNRIAFKSSIESELLNFYRPLDGMNPKNILVTGATGNLGSACVAKVISEGHNAIAIDSPGRSLAAQKNLFNYEVDLTQEGVVKSLLADIINNVKTIDAAILTVGGFAMGSIETTSAADIQKMFTLNF